MSFKKIALVGLIGLAIFVFIALPLIGKGFAANPKSAEPFVNPPVVGGITDALVASGNISPVLPGILLFGGAIAFLFAGNWLLKKILR